MVRIVARCGLASGVPRNVSQQPANNFQLRFVARLSGRKRMLRLFADPMNRSLRQHLGRPPPALRSGKKTHDYSMR
jgi:hypothetical protein